ncbi:helix-turn-helix transcriptional regulator [Pedococcus sp. NPDC057267]|uniref:helix-turn-helix transcriptional regulator n=1 Tax=Pedococcus sp. NPDC057267 TaxID=3346077 RepID=UPI00362D2D51
MTVEQLAAPERLMNVKEVAEYLGVCVRTVWTLRAEGNFAPGTKIGKKVVWRESVLRQWLVESTEEPGESATYRYRSAG